jgi:general secretion pathway protein N
MDRIFIAFLAGSAIFAALLLGELGAATDEPSALPSAARTEAPITPPAQRPRGEELVQTSLAQPLFSVIRRPPDQPAGDRAPGPELPNLRLTGIIIEPEYHLAIFAVPGGKPLARAEGETINEWRLESVGPNQVSLSGPNGITILEPKADPNLVRQKQTAPPAVRPHPPAAATLRPPAPRTPGPQPGAIAFPPALPSVPAAGPVGRPNPARPQ